MENGDWGLENGGGALGAAFLLVIGWSVSPATGIYELSRHYRREEIIDGILGIIRRGLCNEGVSGNMVNVTHGSAGHSESGR